MVALGPHQRWRPQDLELVTAAYLLRIAHLAPSVVDIGDAREDGHLLGRQGRNRQVTSRKYIGCVNSRSIWPHASSAFLAAADRASDEACVLYFCGTSLGS